jgi:hypothetical protein
MLKKLCKETESAGNQKKFNRIDRRINIQQKQCLKLNKTYLCKGNFEINRVSG